MEERQAIFHGTLGYLDVICKSCNGSGGEREDEPCEDCQGVGFIPTDTGQVILDFLARHA